MEERIYRSPAPEIQIPEVNLTEQVIGGVAARGDHPAIVDSATGKRPATRRSRPGSTRSPPRSRARGSAGVTWSR